jgi:hypothetical protein
MLVDPRAKDAADTTDLAAIPRSMARSNHPSQTPARNRGERQPAEGVVLIEDDGRTLWASPTHGRPLELEFLPPGAQIVVALRPEALAEHPEADKVFAAVGSIGIRAAAFLNGALLEPIGLDRLLAGFDVSADGVWGVTLVAHLTGSRTADEHLAAKLSDARKETYHGVNYRLTNQWAYWVPESHDGKLLVAAAPERMKEIIDLAGSPPPLRRDMERLLASTDADRHLTVLLAPNALFSEGRSLWNDELRALRSPLFWFLGDELSAATLSLHWGDDFFIELTATPTLDTSIEQASRILTERVAQIPDQLEEYVVGLDPHDYGRRVIARFPGMVRKLAAYTRGGFDENDAVLRCYLPVVAGHNVLMGAELTLAETSTDQRLPVSTGSQKRAVAETTTAPDGVRATSARERLKRETSLVIARDTLEAALEQLSRDIGVEIVILGTDLQAEGITKNQSLGIQMTDRPAEEVLVEILRLANPDKTATGTNDPKQSLIYIIRQPNTEQPEQIVITTRAAAAGRGDELPAVFRSAQL